MKITIDQAIGSTVKYSIEWADDLESGQAIASTDFVVPAQLTQTFATFSGTVTSVYLANNTGVDYDIFEIRNRVTVNNPDAHQRVLDEFTFRIRLLPTLYK